MSVYQKPRQCKSEFLLSKHLQSQWGAKTFSEQRQPMVKCQRVWPMKEQEKLSMLPMFEPGSLGTVVPFIKMEGWKERTVLKADIPIVKYHSLCKLLFGYANEQGCRSDV